MKIPETDIHSLWFIFSITPIMPQTYSSYLYASSPLPLSSAPSSLLSYSQIPFVSHGHESSFLTIRVPKNLGIKMKQHLWQLLRRKSGEFKEQGSWREIAPAFSSICLSISFALFSNSVLPPPPLREPQESSRNLLLSALAVRSVRENLSE